MFDFSNYLKDSKFFDETNKKVIDKMKDVASKSKMYSMKNIDDNESNTTKGVNIATEFNDFKDTLLNTKKKSDKKWEEFTAKSIKLEHMKSTKYDYLFLMTKDLF